MCRWGLYLYRSLAVRFENILAWLVHAQRSSSKSSDILEVSSSEPCTSSEDQGVESFLRLRLRKIPYWGAGHLKLGRLALSQKRVALGFASALAAKSLGELSEALILEAQCHLAVGNFEQSLEMLNQVSLSGSNRLVNELRESKAAALLALQRFSELEQLLESCVDPETEILKRYAQKKRATQQVH